MKIIPFWCSPAKCQIPLALWLVLLLLVAQRGQAAGIAYYSNGRNIEVPMGNANVTLADTADATSKGLTATVSASTSGPVTVRLPLNGTGQPGYRVGILVSTANAASLLALSQALQLEALGTITLRTYLGTALQQQQVVDAAVAQVALLAGASQPMQLEFSSQATFDRVEVTFGQALRVGLITKIRYAYAIGPDTPKQVKGFLSQFTPSATSRYSTAGTDSGGGVCLNDYISNPERAVDADLTNYASFANLASLGTGCGGTLRVQLAGTVPATGYRAGFVIGNAGLLDLGVLSALRLRTYYNKTVQETSAGASLLQLTLLSDNKAFISFPATRQFDEVSIERTAALDVLNNLNIYYGFGLENAGFTTSPIATSYPLNQGKYTAKISGCTLCGSSLVAPSTGAPYIAFNQTVGLQSVAQATLPLNGTGIVGNRAGMVLGQGSLVDASALANLTLATYDEAGNLLETATGGSLLALAVLPGGKQEVSFRTSRSFAQVGLTFSSTLAAVTNLRVYSAFADDLGTLQVASPVSPLPVVLTSFGVSRPTGTTAAEVVWATASEQRSASFVVERATNPQGGFQAVGQVAAAGTSTATHQYRLRDAAAPTGVVLYYRLRQVDSDGSEQLSPVATLAAAGLAEGFALYPNPATDGPVSLSLPATVAAGSTVAIYSSVGQLLRQQPVGSEGQPAALATTGLPMGIYQVVLRDAAGQKLAAKRLVLSR